MTNGDKIRQLNNEELARLIFAFIITSKDSTFFEKLELDDKQAIENSKGYKLLVETFNEEVDYE